MSGSAGAAAGGAGQGEAPIALINEKVTPHGTTLPCPLLKRRL
jgi:hypothetical protein